MNKAMEANTGAHVSHPTMIVNCTRENLAIVPMAPFTGQSDMTSVRTGNSDFPSGSFVTAVHLAGRCISTPAIAVHLAK